MSTNQLSEDKEKAVARPVAGTGQNAATEDDVFAKQEKLFTGGTSEMPS